MQLVIIVVMSRRGVISFRATCYANRASVLTCRKACTFSISNLYDVILHYIRLTTHAKNKLAAAQTNMERSMLNITYRDRKTNIWVREKVTDVNEQVRRRKWTWAGYVSKIRDNRWTLRITTWKPYERKIPRGRRTRRLLEGYHLAEDSAR